MQCSSLFLFEMIEKGKSVIIYGLGNIGKSYIEQIEMTRWCNIVGVSDKWIHMEQYPYLTIDQIAEKKNYDYIVIAIESVRIAGQVYTDLIKLGINKGKILNMNMRYGEFPVLLADAKPNVKLKIVISEGSGGIGDGLIDMVFIKKLREVVADKGEIIFFCKHADYFRRFEIADEVIENGQNRGLAKEIKSSADLVFQMHSIAIVEIFNEEKVRATSEQLYRYCVDCIRFYKELFSHQANNFRITKYGLLRGKNRIEHTDIHGILGIKRTDKLSIPIYEEELQYIGQNGLTPKGYITINRDAGTGSDAHTKLWPIDYYIRLLKNIKMEYPELCIVLIGTRGDSRLKSYVDKDLTGNTSLPETNVVLKNSFLHIGSEGGLVHLMHFLHGKSMVFFGPTDVRVFGYDENINLYTNACMEHCTWITDNWIEGCLKGDYIPDCMKTVTPEAAYTAFKRYMSENW